jgi:hypothetical protein
MALIVSVNKEGQVTNKKQDGIKIRATFVGRDGSLGYQHGKPYDLTLVQNEKKPFITIIRRNLESCPYDSIYAFLDNWTDVKQLPEG